MRKWITLLMTSLVAGSISSANANFGQAVFEAGYRHDDLSWSSRFPADDPFLKTSTKFKNIDIFQIGVNARTTLGCNFYLRANAYWGWVLDGNFKHSVDTYFSPGYSGEFELGFGSHRRNVVDDKWVYGLGAAVGYPFYFCDCSMIVAPVIGYAIDEQNFTVDDRGLDLCRSEGVFFPVSGDGCCSRKFVSRWYGPFVGVDFAYRPCGQCWDLYAALEYHWGCFHGKRNFDNEFNYFGFDRNRFHSHNADAWVFSAGASYDFCNDWTFGFGVKFQDWSASRHHHNDGSCGDEYYGYSESGREKNAFKWHSYELKLAIGKEF